MASELDSVLENAKKQKKAIEDQKKEIENQLKRAQDKIDSIPFDSPEDRGVNKTARDAAVKDRTAIQGQLVLANAEKSKLDSSIAVISGKIKNPDPVTAQNTAELKRMEENFKAGKGFVSDAQVQVNDRADATRAEQIANQAADREDRQAGRSQQASENAASRGQDQSQFDATMVYNQGVQQVNKDLEEKKITAREAEIKINSLFNETKIAQDNVNSQNSAASTIYQGKLTARSQNISARQGGQSEATSVGSLVLQIAKAGNWKGTFGELTDMVNGFIDKVTKPLGEYNADKAGKTPSPGSSLTQTAAGGQRVGLPSSGNPAEPPLPGQKAKEVLTPDSNDTFIDAVIKTELGKKFAELEQAKITAGDNTPVSGEEFTTHLQQLEGTTETPTDPDTNAPVTPAVINEQVNKGVPVAPPVAPPLQPNPSPVPAAFGPNPNLMNVNKEIPASSGVGGININVNPTPAPVAAPVPVPPEQSQDPMLNGQADQDIGNAATAETLGILQQAGFDPAIIDQFSQSKKYDSTIPNPFLQHLQAQQYA